MVMTSDSFLTKVASACLWSSTEANWPRTGAQLLSLADDLILGEVWPSVIKLARDYYVCTLDHELVADYSRYRQPSRTFGPLLDVLYVDADGDETSMSPMTLDDLGHLDRLAGGGLYYFVDGDHIGVYPTPETGETGTLRIRYFRAPNTLALLATATTVTEADFSADPDALTVDDGSLFTTGDLIDVISAGNAHAALAEDMMITRAGDVLTASSTLLGSGVRAGDYVAPAGTTPILQVPDHAVPWLVQLTAAEAIRQMDPDASARLEGKAARLHAAMVGIASPRTLGEPQSAGDPSADLVWR